MGDGISRLAEGLVNGLELVLCRGGGVCYPLV